jgi:hypothetical protein
MDVSTKRAISQLSNASSVNEKSYFIFNKYCIIDKQVFEKRISGRDVIWEESEVDYLTVINKAGLKKGSKKKIVDYLKALEDGIETYKEHGQITISNPFKISKVPSEINSSVIKYYNLCFGGVDGGKKDLSDFYILGQIIKELGQAKSIDVIFNANYKHEFFNSKTKKNKRSAIQKNIIGSTRFLIFAEKLPHGVYQIVNIPITYFVKITKNGWNDFICGRNEGNYILNNF